MEIILASQSPRRKELLGLFPFSFMIRVADIDEGMNPLLPPQQEVARVSRLKALAVSRQEDDLVIAADTIVVCDGQVLGKPIDAEDAYRMLRMLSGRSHQVMTGLTVLRGDQEVVTTEITTISFRELTDREIRRYIASGEPMDKAGSYGIQGGAALFAQQISGDYFNVVGLPVCRLGQILQKIAPDVMEESQ